MTKSLLRQNCAELHCTTAGARVMSSLAGKRNNITRMSTKAQIRFVNPSEYTRLDLSNPEIYNLHLEYERVQSR